MIWVVFALPFEAGRFGPGWPHVGIRILGTTGVRAREAFLGQLSGTRPAAVLLAGLAGGLDPACEVGEVFADAESEWAGDRIAGLPRARILTLPCPATSVEEKAELWRASGARLCDMETAHLREVCALESIPFLSLRAVSDSASDPLPVPGAILCDPSDGKTRLGRLLFFLISHPQKVSAFVRMVRSSFRARCALHRCCADVVGNFR